MLIRISHLLLILEDGKEAVLAIVLVSLDLKFQEQKYTHPKGIKCLILKPVE